MYMNLTCEMLNLTFLKIWMTTYVEKCAPSVINNLLSSDRSPGQNESQLVYVIMYSFWFLGGLFFHLVIEPV